jgi:multidrug efflux system membrane fusion protein
MPAARAPAQREPAPLPARAASPQVSVAQPIERVIAENEEFAGRLAAVQSVELRARVTGMLSRVLFKAGPVKQGDVLYEIDPRPFQAALDRAGADYHLREAQLKLALNAVERDRALVTRAAIAKEDLNRDEAALVTAEAALNLAKADLEVAKVNLESTRVSAPIDGQIGPPVIDPGNVVKAFETSLGILVSVDPVYASFNMDERTLLRLRRQQLNEGKTTAGGAAHGPVFMGLADEDGFPHQGQFDSSDPRLDAATGTLRCRAVFPNPKGLLMPGMSARLRLSTAPPAPALLVPEQAVGTDRDQRIVHVVTEANVVERRMVALGSLVDGLRVIRSGLSTGDWIVIDPPRGLAAGTKVEPQRKAIPIEK